jgi:hypothetical protein
MLNGCPVAGDPDKCREDECLACEHYPDLDEEPEGTFHPNPEVKFLNVYLEDRAYGGPEEGGWWFSYGILERCEPVPTEKAEERKAELEKEYSNEGRRDINSVLSEGRYSVQIDDRPGADWPEERPHYE